MRFRQFLKNRILLGARRFHERMEPAHNLGRSRVQFRTFAEAVESRVGQLFRLGRKCRLVHVQVVAQHIVQRFLPGIIGSVFEQLVAEVLRKTHDLKQMAVAVACQRRHSHARQHFAQARTNGRARLLCAASLQRLRKLVREVGHHRARPGSYEQGDVMRVKHLR